MPVDRRGVGASAGAESGTGSCALAVRAALARADARAVTTVSTSVFQAAHERHWPSQRRKSAPQA
jgi:hypothetical protein